MAKTKQTLEEVIEQPIIETVTVVPEVVEEVVIEPTIIEETVVEPTVVEPVVIEPAIVEQVNETEPNLTQTRIAELERSLTEWKWSGFRQNKIRQEIESLKSQL